MNDTLADRVDRLPPDELRDSLTPYADLAEKAIAGMMAKVGPRMKATGPRGARARLQVALNAALHRAQAYELDAGMTQRDLIPIMAETIGCLISSMTLQITYRKPRAERMETVFDLCGMVSTAACQAVDNSDDMADGDFSAVAASITPTARA